MVRLSPKHLYAMGWEHRPSTWGWLPWTGLVSLGLNIWGLVYVLNHRPVMTPLDRFASLHTLPLVNENAMADTTPLAHSMGNVVATSFFTDEFATAVAALGHSLNRVNTTARRIALYIPEQVSPRGLCIATATGFEPHPIQRIKPPDGGDGVWYHFIDQYTKLRLWELGDSIGAEAVVYLDADMLAMRNFDELFSLPYGFAASPDVLMGRKGFRSMQFNAGMLFVRPDGEVFRDMLRKIGTASYGHSDAEQGFLNAFYAKDVVRLPFHYNANLAIKLRNRRLWEGIREEIRVVHYTVVKPFTKDEKSYEGVPMHELVANARRRAGEWGGMFAEEIEVWARTWQATYATYGRKLEDCKELSNKPGIH